MESLPKAAPLAGRPPSATAGGAHAPDGPSQRGFARAARRALALGAAAAMAAAGLAAATPNASPRVGAASMAAPPAAPFLAPIALQEAPAAGPAATPPAPDAPAASPSLQETGPPLGDDWRQWRGVFFRVEPPHAPDAAPTASYMLGTLHFGSLQELNLDAGVLQDALRQTRLFVDEAAAPETWPASLDRYRSLPARRGLSDLLGAAPFATLTRLLPDIPPDHLRRMKPWLALALLESRGEIASGQTLDRVVADWARQQGLPAHHLETLEAQLQALDCVPAQEHAPVLRQRLATPWLFEERSRRVLEFYQAGDLPAWLDEIEAMIGLDAAAGAVEHRARLCLIEARNHRWLAQLDPLLRSRGAFVAIGAIHLTGSDGLLAGLRQRGYTITALAR